MKKITAVLFIVFFSLQVLPVKELGKALFKIQMVEEDAYCCGDGIELSKLKKEIDPFCFGDNFRQKTARAVFYTRQINIAVHAASGLPDHFIADILTPPPNC